MAKQFFLICAIVCIVRVSNSLPLDNERHIATTTPQPPASIREYNYEPIENGGTYTYKTSTGVYREETIQILNRGTPEEEFIITGLVGFSADDGYRYNIHYSYDKNGRNVTIDSYPIKRIPPNALKSLVG